MPDDAKITRRFWKALRSDMTVMLGIGGDHGVAREREVFGQVAAGGQALAGAELAVEHGAAQRFVELAVQRQRVLGAQAVHFGEQEFGQH